jgi:TonB family protein
MRKTGPATLLLSLVCIGLALAQEPSPPPAEKPPPEKKGVWLDTVMIHLDASREGGLLDSVVDERPHILSGPPLTYPDLLRQAGVQGRVIVRAIVDTMGRAEPGSVQIVQTPNVAFNQSARDYMLHARFRPARLHGRPVRVLVNVPIDYKIGEPLSPYDVRRP